MKRRIAVMMAAFTTMALLVGLVATSSAVGFKKDAAEGCTPGYWKQSQHFGNWADPYDPADTFVGAGPTGGPYFEAVAGHGTVTLLQVLQQGGGGWHAAGRHLVAALLNASSGIDFAYSPDEVVTAFQTAWNSNPQGDPSALKEMFEDYNELGCPLGRAE